VVGDQARCRQLTSRGGFGELSVVGARSVPRRYSDAWFEAARRHQRGERAGFPRRKRFLVPIRCYHGTFLLAGDRRVRAQRRAEARHRRRVHQAHHQAARQVIAFAMAHRGGDLGGG
jgi:hypothetical protein